MIKNKTVNKEEEVAESIICDICNKTFSYEKDRMEIQEFIRIYNRGGYSSIFGDGAPVELDMCQHCFKDKLGQYVRIGLSEMDRMAIGVGFCTEEQILKDKKQLLS